MRSLLFAPLAVGFFVVAQDSTPKRVVVFPNGSIQARGACNVQPDSVACWDMDGAKSPELEDMIRASLSNGNEVSFRLGKKNRYLAVRRPQTLGVNYRYGANGSTYAGLSSGTDPATEFLRIATDPSEKELAVTAQTTVQNDKPEEIVFREGASASIDGRKLEIGASSKVAPGKGEPGPRYVYNGGRPPLGPSWSIVLGVTGGKEGEYSGWNYIPVDSEGQPIRYVDANGKPISGLKALSLEPTLQNGNGYSNGYPEAPPKDKPKAAAAYFQAFGQTPAFRATTNIDPKSIASLRVFVSHQLSEALGPFPLDPK